ncbi:MAG TPA: LytTR family DNA-binding domain-containing protein [Vicinamibacterales bacterium]|nr:LytTR family DNA-binding domain-containing protein [Vicinamibacterales bacterium]
MKAFLVDDEPIAIDRLRVLLQEHGGVDVIGAGSDPVGVLASIRASPPDVLFLDIEMPGLSGFELLEQLGSLQPLVVFTTAYDEYALDAFKVNSIDYLLKPIERADLARALAKLERVLHGAESPGDLVALLQQVRAALTRKEPDYLVRVPSRTGERVDFVDVADVTHFYAKDKLTFGATSTKHYVLDLAIADLEPRLDPRHWLRIHRSTLVNISAIKEVHTWFAGKAIVKLKDGKTELPIPRERVAEVKAKLGL